MPRPIRALAAFLAGHPKGSLFTASGFAVFLWDRFNDYQSGTGLMVKLLGPDWFSEVAHSPWFTLAGLVIGIAMLWNLARIAERESEAQIAAQEQKNLDLLRPVFDLVDDTFVRADTKQARMTVEESKRRLDAYATAITNVCDAGPQQFSRYALDPLAQHLAHLNISLIGLRTILRVKQEELPFTISQPHTTMNTSQKSYTSSSQIFDFDPALNDNFISRHRKMLEWQSQQLGFLESEVIQRELRDDRSWQNLRERLEQWRR